MEMSITGMVELMKKMGMQSIKEIMGLSIRSSSYSNHISQMSREQQDSDKTQ
jgi:hypothetical protein